MLHDVLLADCRCTPEFCADETDCCEHDAPGSLFPDGYYAEYQDDDPTGQQARYEAAQVW